MNALNIGEVARQSGLQHSAIRYYESIGLLPAPQRIGGWRSYAPDVLNRLRVIRTARDMGFTLDEIHLLLDGFSAETPPSERWMEIARTKLPEVEAYLERANALKNALEIGLRCECVTIESCFGEDGDMCAVEPAESCGESSDCETQTCGG
jgi:MerR family transcriptional regulator, redox-sensitive transcriptional activator SoxR